MNPPLSRNFKIGLFILLALAQLTVYFNSFNVKPSGDDFGVPLSDVLFIKWHGIWTLFIHSNHAHNYRPTLSVVMWLFTKLIPGKPLIGDRILHLLCAFMFGGVGMLWLDKMRVGRTGFIAGSIVLFLHPVLVAPLASIDGFGTPFCTALVWLAGYLTYVWRDSLGKVIAGTLICYVIAIGFKEFAFAMVPLCGWVLVCFRQKRGFVSAVLVGIPLMVGVGLYMIAMNLALPPGHTTATDRLVHNAHEVIDNATRYGAGLLFLGNTVWAFVNLSAKTAAIVMAAMSVFVLFIGGGIFILSRQSAAPVQESGFTLRRWLVFILLSFLAVSFPACLVQGVSEMYLPPVVASLALLVALASDGWATTPLAPRVGVSIAALVGLFFSITTIEKKVDGLVDAGDRADYMLQQLNHLVPAGARNLNVGMVFDENQIPPHHAYSVFLLTDDQLVYAPGLQWARPDERDINVWTFPVYTDGQSLIDTSQYDLWFKWDIPTRTLSPMPKH